MQAGDQKHTYINTAGLMLIIIHPNQGLIEYMNVCNCCNLSGIYSMNSYDYYVG